MADAVTTVKKITKSGNALVVSITKEVQALEVGQGDWVEVTIRQLDWKNFRDWYKR